VCVIKCGHIAGEGKISFSEMAGGGVGEVGLCYADL
jgi:hypothetical protein